MNILEFTVNKDKKRVHYANIATIKNFYYDGEYTHLDAGDTTFYLDGDRTTDLRKALCRVDDGMLIKLD